jgi:hypothetical protein
MTNLDWVPASCTLPTKERPLRVAEWDALFAEHVRAVSRPEPLHVRLDLGAGTGLEERVRDLVEREGGCCSFFTFTLVPDAATVRLDVAVDEAHASVLDAVAARAAGAGQSR